MCTVKMLDYTVSLKESRRPSINVPLDVVQGLLRQPNQEVRPEKLMLKLKVPPNLRKVWNKPGEHSLVHIYEYSLIVTTESNSMARPSMVNTEMASTIRVKSGKKRPAIEDETPLRKKFKPSEITDDEDTQTGASTSVSLKGKGKERDPPESSESESPKSSKVISEFNLNFSASKLFVGMQRMQLTGLRMQVAFPA